MIEINNKEAFEKILSDNSIVIAVFSAPWCGPCRMLSSVIDQVEPEYSNVLFVKINTDEATALAAEYSIQSLPTIVIFKDGKQVNSSNGFMTNTALKTMIDNNL